MLLGQISYLDCLAFIVFLVPNLLLQVSIFELLKCAFFAVPYICKSTDPIYISVADTRESNTHASGSFFYERLLVSHKDRSPFVQHATWFQDVVIRCVRYAFANIQASIGAVFLGKATALPFLYFRLLRHGLLRSPIHWEEVRTVRRLCPNCVNPAELLARMTSKASTSCKIRPSRRTQSSSTVMASFHNVLEHHLTAWRRRLLHGLSILLRRISHRMGIPARAIRFDQN
ncbi:hypothetical protein MRB53_037015 [Persea americana]|nr:hypothetical protein MRB53_037015 [Persea americana]